MRHKPARGRAAAEHLRGRPLEAAPTGGPLRVGRRRDRRTSMRERFACRPAGRAIRAAQSLGSRETNPAGRQWAGILGPRSANAPRDAPPRRLLGGAGRRRRAARADHGAAEARARRTALATTSAADGRPALPWRAAATTPRPRRRCRPPTPRRRRRRAGGALGEVDDPELWSAARVAEWVAALQPPLDRRAGAFANGVDGAALRRLGASELPSLGVRDSRGPRLHRASRELFGMATPRTSRPRRRRRRCRRRRRPPRARL